MSNLNYLLVNEFIESSKMHRGKALLDRWGGLLDERQRLYIELEALKAVFFEAKSVIEVEENKKAMAAIRKKLDETADETIRVLGQWQNV